MNLACVPEKRPLLKNLKIWKMIWKDCVYLLNLTAPDERPLFKSLKICKVTGKDYVYLFNLTVYLKKGLFSRA